MQILITAAASLLAQTLAEKLSPQHQVRLTERVEVTVAGEFVCCPLSHDPATNALVRGMDAIVHVAEPLPDETPNQKLDYLARCSYNLLWAAVEERVSRLILLSTLRLMTAYPAAFTVTESWRPRPSCEPEVLAKHLGESVCREFAREKQIDILILRLGTLVGTGQTADPLGVDPDDVAQAVSRALIAPVKGFGVFHIQAGGSAARFSVERARRALDYNPKLILGPNSGDNA